MMAQRKKSISVVMAALFLLLTLTACQPSNIGQAEQSRSFSFEDYKDDEIFDIEKVQLSRELAEKCDSYKFTYLSDGYKIKAYISIPVSALQSSKPCKCVLFNRGGNSSMGYLDDNSTAKMCAVFDRIVIASQYRGADGSEGKDQFGGDDLRDVIKLIDLCGNRFSFADMDDFCVAGVSRGGMMTYMAARQDSRIKRIISVSGVCDLLCWYEQREDMQPLLKDYIGFTPQENPSEYEKRSVVCWYDEIRIPVLMIHSKQDARVSYQQAEELYRKLKSCNDDCDFITHDDDYHGIHAEDLTSIREFLNHSS